MLYIGIDMSSPANASESEHEGRGPRWASLWWYFLPGFPSPRAMIRRSAGN